jgi:hypothetical protein
VGATKQINVAKQLEECPESQELAELLRWLRTTNLTKDQVTIVLGQWFHPLRFFVQFLATFVATLAKSNPQDPAIALIVTILHQEAGEGRPDRSHLELFIISMCGMAGFSNEVITGSAPFPATKALVGAYARFGQHPNSGRAATLGTETKDLEMVVAISAAVRKATEITNLPWENVHRDQEPQRAQNATRTALWVKDPEEQEAILDEAQTMLRYWVAFFKAIKAEVEKLPRAA